MDIRLSEHLRGVEAGQVIEVTDRARPIARLVPIAREVAELDLLPAQRSFASVRKRRFPSARFTISSLDVLCKERGDR